MLTQIYEVSTPEEARSISEIGVDHIGVLVRNGEFPRELPFDPAAEVAAAVVPPSKVSALFLTADTSLIEEWALRLQPEIVHLGAAPELLGPDDAAILKRRLPKMRLMRSIPVVGQASMTMARSYDGIVDFLLLDSHRESDRQIGALGIIHDWTISRRIVELVRAPVILAGALGPDNVATAIGAVQPAGVDSKTKTDRDGTHRKDLDRVRRFREAAGVRACTSAMDLAGADRDRGADMPGHGGDGPTCREPPRNPRRFDSDGFLPAIASAEGHRRGLARAAGRRGRGAVMTPR